MLDEKIKNKILIAQKNGITEHIIYARLALVFKDKKSPRY